MLADIRIFPNGKFDLMYRKKFVIDECTDVIRRITLHVFNLNLLIYADLQVESTFCIAIAFKLACSYICNNCDHPLNKIYPVSVTC